MKAAARRDFIFLIPLALACVLALYRFPLIQFDDHLIVISEIYQTWSWPLPSQRLLTAHHSLVHHTLAALTWKAPEMLGLGSVYWPESVQVLSLLYALGTILFTALIVRRVVSDPSARRMAFIVFGTFTGFIISAVTVSNDMAVAFWGTAALLQTVRIMRDGRPPSYRRIVVLGLLLGMAVLMKVTALVMIPASVLCLISRRRYYCERWNIVLKRSAVLCLVGLIFYTPTIVRFRATPGKPLFSHEVTGGISLRNRSLRFDIFSVPLKQTIKRPFDVVPYASEGINPADYSLWTSLFLSNWILPSHLPHPPEPHITVLFTLSALIMTICFGLGVLIGLRAAFSRPEYFVVAIWLMLFMAVWITANLFFGYSGGDVRYALFSIGSQITFLALCWQFILKLMPRFRILLWVFIAAHLILFWLMTFSGPFYYFYPDWPRLLPA